MNFDGGGPSLSGLTRPRRPGLPQRTQLVHVWRMEDGKVVRFQQYADTLQVARVIGAV